MSNTFQVQVKRQGIITLPKELRENNHIKECDLLTLIDLGDGVVVNKSVSLACRRNW
jgi:AbrB family looped-hinge helix DNA binding protein